MRGFVLGKIAADLDQALARREASGAPGRTTGRLVAGGNGWSVEDVLCTDGPQARTCTARPRRTNRSPPPRADSWRGGAVGPSRACGARAGLGTGRLQSCT